MPEPIRAVAYYRMSTVGQETSIPEQREWVQRTCPREGVEVVREFEDPGVPGSEIERRAGLQEMMSFCERQATGGQPVEAVVCWDADRFSRADSIRTAVCIARLIDAGVSRMLTAEGWVDWTDDIDRVLLNLKQDLSRSAYSKSLSKNVTRSALKRALAGYWPASRAPYGYRAVPTNAEWYKWVESSRASFQPPKLCRLQPHEEQSEWVAWIFNEFANTAASLGDLARRLRELGAPPPPARTRKKTGERWGGEWTRYGVWSILRNRAYLGELRWNADRRGKYNRVAAGDVTAARAAGRKRKKQHNDAKDVIVIPDAHPSLVSEETFDACARKLAGSRWKRTTPAPGGGEWVLSGLLYCGDCGGRMVGHTDRHRRGTRTYTYRHYVCHTNVRRGPGSCRRNQADQDVILREVARLIRESFTEPTRLKELRAEVEALAGEEGRARDAERERLAARVEELDRQIDQGAERLLLCPPEALDRAAAKLKAWQAERDEAGRALALLDEAVESSQRFATRVLGALEALGRLEDLIATAPPAAARDALAGLVSKITLKFEHGEEVGGGRRRTVLDSLEVDLLPEAVHLLGTGASTRS
jgi:site-specific DNA recombinase